MDVTTEAGKRLLGNESISSRPLLADEIRDHIAAIEAEARADALREVEERVAALPRHVSRPDPLSEGRVTVDRAACLAIVREEAERVR